MTAKERKHFERLQWIARLTPENCPGGIPTDERGWRDLVNKIVLDVRAALRDFSDEPDRQVLFPNHGGYRKLKGFQVATIVYDATRIFCDRFVPLRSRTHDQMVQAARSGRQNIAEGSMAAATSKKTELKLTNVAKASLEELLLDYEDFLRQQNLRQWGKDAPEALDVRGRYRNYPESWFDRESEESDTSDMSDSSDSSEPRSTPLLDPYGIENASPEVAANTLICLTNQAIYLLKRQLKGLEEKFLTDGGFTERLYNKRRDFRRKRN